MRWQLLTTGARTIAAAGAAAGAAAILGAGAVLKSSSVMEKEARKKLEEGDLILKKQCVFSPCPSFFLLCIL